MLGMKAEDPGRYALEFAICRELGWSWSDLLEAPRDFVSEIAYRLSFESKWTEKKQKLDQQKTKAKQRHGKR